jgi:hypothetical protein
MTIKTRLRKKLTAKTSWYKERDREEQIEGEKDVMGETRKLGSRDGGNKKAHGRMKQKGGSIQKRGLVKAVMFVPYTHGSKLAKELREVEETMEGLTGYRMKIVERGGRKLSDMLCKSNPWEGKYCVRPNCLHCDTKLRTGKHGSQSCSKRSSVYETWCVQCEEKDKVRNADGRKTEVQLHKYIGETARSSHERGLEHWGDAMSLNPKSHILKHFAEHHMGERIEEIVADPA